uniref:Uncharacterized protein n=1 Tax=Chromera velia CCMP2878 TaxID=1169474 RepID=A0A0G4G9P1_9ALVE|eukprot:Cvel_20890.t1-p1 / transcript=Cvel_20890.t1 / gene=Cvel_20890 / organism=Chromera_velia_CCMP2878 / gene_product=hypothetical protein / transcript_product=hypothetical protein / location=Cvel_scaffold1915:23333-23722(+) / protein_length=130 / sequence_SO=supercontig / SO=protein_coding / is_pseudo=false
MGVAVSPSIGGRSCVVLCFSGPLWVGVLSGGGRGLCALGCGFGLPSSRRRGIPAVCLAVFGGFGVGGWRWAFGCAVLAGGIFGSLLDRSGLGVGKSSEWKLLGCRCMWVARLARALLPLGGWRVGNRRGR